MIRTILCALMFAGQARAAGLAEADALFGKRLYQEALTAYSSSLGAPGDDGLRALYRSAECEALLQRYGEAAQRLYGVKLPADPLWRGRLLLLRAETVRQYLLRYGYSQSADEQKGTDDITKLTGAQLSSRISADYDALWPLRGDLARARMEDEGYFADLRGADLAYTPTLWDFAVLRWSDWLLSQGGADRAPEALPFVKPVYRADYSASAPAASKAAALFEDAASLSSSDMDFAREYWRLQRLRIPLDHPGVVAVADPAALRAAAAATLEGWASSFKTSLGRAWALYYAASLRSEASAFGAAVDLCGRAAKEAPRSKPEALCAKLAAEIELPRLELTAAFAPPPGKGSLKVKTRNLPQVYFRAYRTTPEELQGLGSYEEQGWGRVRYLQQDAAKAFLARKPDAAWNDRIKYPARYDYAERASAVPPLSKGLYVVVASGDSGFEDGSSLMKAVALNITDIFLLGTAGPAGDPEDFLYDPEKPGREVSSDVFRLYALDALTGRPLAGADIDAYFSSSYGNWRRTALRTGQDGEASLSLPLRISYPSNGYFSVDPLLRKDGAYAYWASYINASLPVPPPLTVFAETDRPVYRPGQTVRFKATALRREPRGFRVYDGGARVKVTARDPNWQEVYSAELPVTGLGSAAGSFTVPQGRLLGRYTLTAELADLGGTYSGSAGFGVEEYKRPEFEVKLGEPASPWRYGEKASVTGTVRYYFGSPVPGAAVRYRVTRSRYVPWYCWYWNWFYRAGPSAEVASGEARTGDDGTFTFSFTPGPENGELAAYPASYLVEAEARDAGGRTIEDSRYYRAGSRAWLFDVSSEAGFFSPSGTPSLKVALRDLNDAPRAGKAAYSVYRLEKDPAGGEGSADWGAFGANPSLEQAFSAVPDGARVESGALEISSVTPAALRLKPLPPGAYRLRLKASDPWGGEASSELVLVSAAADPAANRALRLPPVALFERASYLPGETARVLIGASALKGPRFVEILAGGFVLDRAQAPGGGLSVYSLKVGPAHRGGFGLRWFGAGGFRIYSAMGEADVPRADRRLSLALDYDKVLAPGQTVSWKLRAADAAGRPVSGEALVRVFDRSLEYYAGDAGFWTDSLYPRRYSSGEGYGSLFAPYAVDLPVRAGLVQKMLDLFRRSVAEPRLASLRVAGTRAGSRRAMLAKGLMEDGGFGGNMATMDLAMPASVGAMSEARAKAAPAAAARPSFAPAPEVKVRKDFSETAFYDPQLKVLGGAADISFRIPERLTSWKIASYMLTRDVRTGSLGAEAVTKKDLMVRLDIPRFFREGDVSRLTAVVTNDSPGVLAGEVSLAVTADGADAAARFGLKDLGRPFEVRPGGTVALYWDLAVPRGTGLYKVRAVARAGALADAQENDLPVLPSRERLLASSVEALDGDAAATLGLPELKAADPTREIEALHVEIQPQLALTVINSLPFLVTYPYECTEQLLNRYVPLAITDAFYARYPALKAAVAKLPRRSTLTPAWERDNPVRMMSLMETPWEELSKGRKAYWPVTDMLDPKTVAAQRAEALEKLAAYQAADGSFPWFPGGRPDFYMTLYVLEGLAEAARYGVEVPRGMAQRALAYALAEAPAHLKPEADETSLALYAAYVVTSFPASWPESRTSLTYAKAWADYADAHSDALTPFGKAYAAYVYDRLGEKAKAASYLDRAMDGARTDPITGVYWAPEKNSWLWYNDTVEKHAFLLRTLLAVRPKDPKVPGLVRWLIFNRKANEWKSTKASAAAVYSLLDVMKSRGSLDKGETFELKWGSTRAKLELKPFDWVSKPLRWSKYGPGLKAADLAPKVEKKGPGLAFVAFNGIYTTDRAAGESPAGLLNVSRTYFRREKEGDKYVLEPLDPGDTVAVGDAVEVHLAVSARSRFEYVHLKDPKPAGFEAEELSSGWRWDLLGRYEEPRDSLTNFFMDAVPQGEYVLKYRLRPTTPGTFRIGAATVQSMYAPEFGAHSAGMTLKVK